MTATKWHFELHDGKGGVLICPEPRNRDQVWRECWLRFGDRLREVWV